MDSISQWTITNSEDEHGDSKAIAAAMPERRMAELFPIFLKLDGRKALVVGGGKMAAVRTKQLISAGARVTVVSPNAGSEIERLAKTKSVVMVRRGFRRADLSRRYFIVIAATDDPKVQQAVFEAAERLGILCNVVDSPASCNFYMPAIVRRGDLKIAISTSGRSPALAGKLRQYLEEAMPENAAELTEMVGRLRSKLRLEIPGDLATQKKLVDEFVERELTKKRSGRDSRGALVAVQPYRPGRRPAGVRLGVAGGSKGVAFAR